MFESLKKFLVEEFRINEEAITMEAELVGDLGINSIDRAELAFACEEKFDVVIDDEDLNNIKTVGDVVRYIESAKG